MAEKDGGTWPLIPNIQMLRLGCFAVTVASSPPCWTP